MLRHINSSPTPPKSIFLYASYRIFLFLCFRVAVWLRKTVAARGLVNGGGTASEARGGMSEAKFCDAIPIRK